MKQEIQCNKILQESLKLHVTKIRENIKPQTFGAISSGDKEPFWLVQWQGFPHQLTAATSVEGSHLPMPVGTWVCLAVYFDRIQQTRCWYKKMKTPNMLFCLRHVIQPDVTVEAYNRQQGNIPPPAANEAYCRDTAPTRVK